MAARTDTVMVFRRRSVLGSGKGFESSGPKYGPPRYYWRKSAGNGRKIAVGAEAFVTLASAVRAAKRANRGCVFDLCVPVFNRKDELVDWKWEYAERP